MTSNLTGQDLLRLLAKNCIGECDHLPKGACKDCITETLKTLKALCLFGLKLQAKAAAYKHCAEIAKTFDGGTVKPPYDWYAVAFGIAQKIREAGDGLRKDR